MNGRLSPPSRSTATVSCPGRGAIASNACAGCAIRHVAICAALDDRELRDLEAISSHRQIAAGQTIVTEGDPDEHAYNIVEGTVKLYKSLADGRTQITGFLLAGDFLGLPARGAQIYSAEALTGTQLCMFQRSRLQAVFDTYPALEERFLGTINDELTAAQDHMLLLGRKTARERLASFLSGLACRLERIGRPIHPLVLPMHRGDIADHLGLTLETVSRTFSRLTREGVIALPKRDRVVIMDRDRLEECAKGG